MKSDAVVLYTLATIFVGSCCGRIAAYVAAVPSANAASSSRHSAKQAANSDDGFAAAGLLAYPDTAFMPPASGAVSFRPRDPDVAGERAVYDPGDELLRALNAEMAATGQELGTLPEEPDYADTVFNELEVASQYDMLRKLESDLREEQDIVTKSAVLMKMLEDPTLDTLPLVYVEETKGGETNNLIYPAETGMSKRSRYYRRYPWKRHNRNRSTYEPELRYACTPTKEDVLKLLVNLHENRKGNHSKTVNFCNRKRPAKAIFTNIRFLG